MKPLEAYDFGIRKETFGSIADFYGEIDKRYDKGYRRTGSGAVTMDDFLLGFNTTGITTTENNPLERHDYFIVTQDNPKEPAEVRAARLDLRELLKELKAFRGFRPIKNL